MKNIVRLCVVAGLASWAINASATEQESMLNRLKENAFFQDSKIDISTRNYWKYLKEDEAQPKEVHAAWGQSITLDFQSGYFADFIGFDATYNGVIKLGASDYFSTRGLLYNDGKGMNKDNASGFNKIGQRYVKIKFNLGDVKFNAKGGWQILKNTGAVTASNRLSQNSYLGYSGRVTYDNVSLDLLYVTSSINRDSPDKVHFLTQNNRIIDYIVSGGINYKSDNLSAVYFYGEAEDYLRRHGLEVSYKATCNLTVGTQVYGSYALDEYKSMPDNSKQFENHAWHAVIDAKWAEKDWSAKLGIGYTWAHKEGDYLGYYYRHLTKNSRGRFNAITSAGVDYMRDGELALAFVTDYKLTPDLTAGIQFNYGQFDYKDNTVRTGEVNIFGRWAPSDPTLKNLSIFAMFGPGWSYKQKNKTPTLFDGHTARSHSLAGEIIIDYKF